MPESVPGTEWDEAAAYVRARTEIRPEIGLVLGSGLGSLAEEVENAVAIPYEQIPHWPVSTVSGHAGRLVLGRLEKHRVLVQQGRAHFYEGYSQQHLAIAVRVMQRLGVRTLILTNAAGGLNESYSPGDLMLIRDHINFPGLAGHNPLRGRNDDSGPRFPDMTQAYDPGLRRLAEDVASQQGVPLREGVYAYLGGPSFETPAELRLLRIAGADAVGMSTVPSVIVARHAGIRVLAISTITNLWLPDPLPGTELSHEEVIEACNRIAPRLAQLIHGVLRRL